MAPVIMANYMKARLPDGSRMESSYIATIQLPARETDPHFPRNVDSSINIVGSFM